MNNKNKLLTVLSDAEQEALYGQPDLDDMQRLEYRFCCIKEGGWQNPPYFLK